MDLMVDASRSCYDFQTGKFQPWQGRTVTVEDKIGRDLPLIPRSNGGQRPGRRVGGQAV